MPYGFAPYEQWRLMAVIIKIRCISGRHHNKVCNHMVVISKIKKSNSCYSNKEEGGNA